VITVQDWAEIRRLHLSEGLSGRAISRRVGVSRTTVDRAVASTRPPHYQRPPVGSAFDAVEVRVRELLKENPGMPATVLAERVGWSGSPSWFRKRVALLRPLFAPKDPADRLRYEAGDQVQSDLWFPAKQIPVGVASSRVLPVLVMVCSFSRFISAVMVPTRTTGDLLAGMWSLLSESIGAVPHRLIWDNEAGIGRRNHLAEGVPGFVGTLATKIVQLKAYDPESKGVVERANGYLETSFLPGREFTGPADFNAQLTDWLVLANTRLVRSLGARPSDLITEDRARMLALPPISPSVGFSQRVRLGRDYYVRVLGNDYSVDPRAIGRLVDVRADLAAVTVSLEGQVITSHPRAWSSRANVTDPTHVLTAAKLRENFQHPTPRPGDDADLIRDLADYDHAFGVDFTIDGQVA
jgi:transposase